MHIAVLATRQFGRNETLEKVYVGNSREEADKAIAACRGKYLDVWEVDTNPFRRYWMPPLVETPVVAPEPEKPAAKKHK